MVKYTVNADKGADPCDPCDVTTAGADTRTAAEEGTGNHVNIVDLDWNQEKIILQREIGMFSAMGLIIGHVIGSGIFMSPVAIVRQCNSVGLSLVVWVVSGVVSVMKAMCFIELGMLFPRAGGEWAYIREINGETLAFLNAYMSMFASRPCSIAMIAKITIDYFMDAFVPECEFHPIVKDLLAAWLIITVVVVNSLPMKKLMIVQNIFTSMKLCAIALIIVTGIIHIAKGNAENFKEPFKGSSYNIANIAVATYAGIYAYDGWQSIYDLMEDVKKPEKIVPRATVVSILTVVVLYIATNIAYFSTMTPGQMSTSSAVALSYAQVTMGSFSRIIPFLVGCSTVGALNAHIMAGSRILFAQGRDGIFPTALCMLSVKYKVPWISAWLICVMTVFYIFVYNIFELFDYLNFSSFFFNILMYGNVIVLRYTRPDLPRPFKCSLICPVFVVSLVIVMAGSGAIKHPFNFLVSQIQILLGLPLFAFVKYCNTHPRFIYEFKYKFNSNLQKLLLIVPPDK